MSNGERLAELSEIAANSADASQLQYLKTLDSITGKTQQLKTSIQALYTESGLEEYYKGILDYSNQLIVTLSKMPTVFRLPIPAIAAVAKTFVNLANVVMTSLRAIKQRYTSSGNELQQKLNNLATNGKEDRVRIAQEEQKAKAQIYQQDVEAFKAAEQQKTNAAQQEAAATSAGTGRRRPVGKPNANTTVAPEEGKTSLLKNGRVLSVGLSAAGLLLGGVSSSLSNKGGAASTVGGVLGALSSAASGAAMGAHLGPHGAIIGGVLGGVTGLLENMNIIFKSLEDQVKDLKAVSTEANNEFLQRRDEVKTLQTAKEKIEELAKSRYDSVEAEQEFITANAELASKYPTLISYYDEAGNAIIDLNAAERQLTEARKESIEAAQKAAIAAYKQAQGEKKQSEQEGKQDRAGTLRQYFNPATGDKTTGVRLIRLQNQMRGHEQELRAAGIDPLLFKLQDNDSLFEAYRESNIPNLFNDQESIEKLQKISDGDDAFLKQFSDYILECYGLVESSFTKINVSDSKIDSAIRSGIAQVNTALVDKTLNPVFAELTNASAVLNNYAYNQYKTGGYTDYQAFINNTLPGLIDEFSTKLNELWINLTTSQQSKVNDLIKNSGNYTQQEFSNKLVDLLKVEGLDDTAQQIVDSTYATAYTIENFNKALATRVEKNENQIYSELEKASGSFSDLGENELKSILDGAEKIASLINGDVISQTQGNWIANQYAAIWEQTGNLDADQIDIAQRLLTAFNDFSYTGVQSLIQSLEEADIKDEKLIGLLNQLKNVVPRNLEIEISSFIDSATAGFEDFEKAVTNAQKGMDLKTASELAAKLGKSLTDFDFRNGLFYLDDIQAIQDGMLKDFNTDELKDAVNKTQSNLSLLEFAISSRLDLFNQTDEEIEEYLDQDAVKNQAGQDYATLQRIWSEYKASSDKTFEEVWDEYFAQRLADLSTIDGYLQDYNIRSLIKTGNLDKAFKKLGVTDADEILKQVSNGELTNNDKVNKYLPELKEALDTASSSAIKSYIDVFKSGSNGYIKIDKNNIKALQTLDQSLKEGDTYIFKYAEMTRDTFVEYLNNFQLTPQEYNSYLEEFESAIPDKEAALKSVLDSYTEISSSTIKTFKDAFAIKTDDLSAYGIGYNETLNKYYIESLDALTNKIDADGYVITDEMQAALDKAARTQSKRTQIADLISKADSIDEATILALSKNIEGGYEIAKDLLTANADGTYSATVSQLQEIIKKLGVGVDKSIEEALAKRIDSAISTISGLAGSQSKGYTSLESMRAFAAKLNNVDIPLVKDEYAQGLFEWNEVLHAYVLTTEGIIAQVAYLKSQLKNTGIEDTEVINQFIENTRRQFAENINVSAFFNANTPEAVAQARDALRKAISDYNDFSIAIGEQVGINSDELVKALEGGGQGAVEALKTVANAQGKTLSADDIQQAYRSSINKLNSAFEQIGTSVGSIIDETTANILTTVGQFDNTKAKFELEDLGGGQYIIKSIGDLADAYETLYSEMLATNAATITELNNAKASAIEARESEGISAISALGDAASMTYTRFGEIIAERGYLLSDELIEGLEKANIINTIGNGKLRIADFSAFADLMNWEINSEEYTSALKTYNDSLVTLNKQVQKDIVNEFESVSKAIPNSLINVTYLADKLQSINQESGATALDALNEVISSYGGYIKDGLLHLRDDANILGISQAILGQIQSNEALLDEDLATLADAVSSLIKGLTNSISKGLKGNLSNAEANTLSVQALNQFGIKLDFSRTSEGLKLSVDSAIQLYHAIQSVDALAANVTFDSLKNSLIKTGEACADMSTTLSSIAKLEEELNKNPKNKQVAERLQLYKEIANVQMQDPNSYNFMDKKLPDYLQGPANYWDSVGKMYTSLNDALAAGTNQGKIEIADFYNMVNELNNLAALGDDIEFMGFTLNGSLESSSKLIQAGLNTLTNVDGKGAMINLGKLGVNLTTGSNQLKKDIQSGVKEMAKSQIEMLDAMIAMLETVVAMEQLSQIDLDNDQQIDLEEIFNPFNVDKPGEVTYTKEYQDLAGQMLDQAATNKELSAALESVKFSNISVKEMLEDTKDGVKDVYLSAEDYKNILNAYYKMALSGNYDLDNLMASIREVMQSSQFVGEIEVGDKKLAVGFGYQLETVNGKYIVGNTEYTDYKAALEASVLEANGVDVSAKDFKLELGQVHEVQVSEEVAYSVRVDTETGEVLYSADGVPETADKREFFEALYDNTHQDGEDAIAWARRQGIKENVILELQELVVDQATFKDATQEQINAYVSAVKSGDKELIETTAKPVGVKLPIDFKATKGKVESLTAAEQQELLSAVGVDSKTVDINGNVSVTGDDQAATVMKYLDSETPATLPINIELNSTDTEALDSVSKLLEALGDEALVNSINSVATSVANLAASAEQLQNLPYDKLNALLESLSSFTSGEGETATFDWTAISQDLPAAIETAQAAWNSFNSSIGTTGSELDSLQAKLNALKSLEIKVTADTKNAASTIALMGPYYKTVYLTANTDAVKNAVDNLKLQTTVTVKTQTSSSSTPELGPNPVTSTYFNSMNAGAKGNLALAKGTLMGELGPELYVTGGHYYVAGQNGAEFVNLPDDAIVFNHLQTKKLLDGQNISGRGDPVKSEKASTSFATGNVTGPALASASQALSALKQIRAMWQSMLDASMKDLGSKASSGGKGGGSSKDSNKTNAGFIADLERWYNLLRQIAKLESKINYEEQLRSKISSDMIQNGTAYYNSQKRSLEYLDQEIARQRELSNLQKSYYDARRQDLASSNFGKIFTFNDEGLMQYNDTATMANGDRGGLFALAEIIRQNPDGSTVYNAQQQYEILKSWGFGEDMRYDDKGKEIIYDKDSKNADDYYTKSVQAFWDKVDAWKDELDGLYDDYNTKLEEILENESERNQILQEMIDNQLSLEQNVLKALEDREQKVIDELENTIDAMQDSADKFVNGLNDQLNKERSMYENNEDANETARLRRQLAILQRSGGSAAQIRDLQNQINTRDREAYFSAQQEQIDAIQKASDLELERLDAQLNIMAETLEYQKQNGLLWEEVYEIMGKSREEIASFILSNGSEWQSKSSLQIDNDLNSLRSSIEQWIARREDEDLVAANSTHNWNTYLASSSNRYGKIMDQGTLTLAKAAYDAEYASSSDPNRAAEAADKILQQKLDEYFTNNPSAILRDSAVKNIATSSPASSTNYEPETTYSSSSGSSSGSSSSSKSSSSSAKSTTSGNHWKYILYKDGVQTNYNADNFATREKAQREASAQAAALQKAQGGRWTYVTKWYKQGGLADYTGLAMLHGSKTEPEAIFNAEQTKVLRNDILGPQDTSLMSLLNSLREYMASGSSTMSTLNENNSSINIEHLELNMNASIGSDYDARRAGENVMEEIVRIARKSSIQGFSRR